MAELTLSCDDGALPSAYVIPARVDRMSRAEYAEIQAEMGALQVRRCPACHLCLLEAGGNMKCPDCRSPLVSDGSAHQGYPKEDDVYLY